MKSQAKKLLFTGIGLCCVAIAGRAQEPPQTQEYPLTLDRAVEMGLQNHAQLKIAQARLETAAGQTSVARDQMLPSVNLSASAFYLGDALVLDSDWSKAQTVDMPHFGNTFSLQASQLLYKGGVIRKSIEVAELQQQLAELDVTANEQEIKFLIISGWLDIQKLMNQLQVLEQNKVLAGQLLANVTELYGEQMVTRNELIRSELQIKNLDQAILTARNNHVILSNRMSYALGLPADALIVPVGDVGVDAAVQSPDYYMSAAHDNHPAMRMAEKNVAIAETNVGLQKAGWVPALSAFGGYNMQRPLTSTTPVLDMYNNTWQAGLSLSFSLDGLFKNRRRVSVSRSQARVSHEAADYTRQNVEIGVQAAWLKWREAGEQVRLMDEARGLANENYEIIRNKYLDQLAITAEITDASNAKLRAELDYQNAVVGAAFQYYNLLKSAGTL